MWGGLRAGSHGSLVEGRMVSESLLGAGVLSSQSRHNWSGLRGRDGLAGGASTLNEALRGAERGQGAAGRSCPLPSSGSSGGRGAPRCCSVAGPLWLSMAAWLHLLLPAPRPRGALEVSEGCPGLCQPAGPCPGPPRLPRAAPSRVLPWRGADVWFLRLSLEPIHVRTRPRMFRAQRGCGD